MALDLPAYEGQVTAEFATVHAGLGSVPAEFSTAGELAVLMGKLPPQTPVSVAETVRIDPGLELGETPNCTAAVATVVTLLDPQESVDVVDGDQVRQYARPVPGIELGAVIVAEGGRAPESTAAFQPFERAAEALEGGDLSTALEAEEELLNWIANTLTREPEDPDDAAAVPSWIADPQLREQVRIEGERIRQAAARLAALRTRLDDAKAADDADADADGDR